MLKLQFHLVNMLYSLIIKNIKNNSWKLRKFFVTLRCANVDLKISLHVCFHIKTITWKFRFLNPKDSRVICLLSFLKSRLIFILFYCFWMFVNKLFTYLTWKCFNVKFSTYFHKKTKIVADFQICISAPLNKRFLFYFRIL